MAASAIARSFHFAERATDLGTEVRAGFTTFMVMAYIIFVNPGRGGLVHPMLWIAAGAFVVYFALPLLERALT